MPRIGLVVEPDFLEIHRGVRVYVHALVRLLEHHGWRADYLMPKASTSGGWRWYALHIREEMLFTGAAPSSSGEPADVWRELRTAAFVRSAPDARVPAGLLRPEVMPLGSTLEAEGYDVLLITNPWMVKWEGRLPGRRVLGLVLDLIPNLFGFILAEHKPFAFASQHAAGFRYYETQCDGILTISEATTRNYLDLVRARSTRTTAPPVATLPPLPPYAPAAPAVARTEPASGRRRQVVLAGCFDARKGLAELPPLLNGLAEEIDDVVVYGMPRCREQEVEAFFSSLRVRSITWHLSPGPGHVRRIFADSRFLLFPSRHEGLGLPLIEAQLEGCRVATYPASPMRELSLSGSVMLGATLEHSVAALSAALSEPFDHDGLRRQAHAAFVAPGQATDPLREILSAMG